LCNQFNYPTINGDNPAGRKIADLYVGEVLLMAPNKKGINRTIAKVKHREMTIVKIDGVKIPHHITEDEIKEHMKDFFEEHEEIYKKDFQARIAKPDGFLLGLENEDWDFMCSVIDWEEVKKLSDQYKYTFPSKSRMNEWSHYKIRQDNKLKSDSVSFLKKLLFEINGELNYGIINELEKHVDGDPILSVIYFIRNILLQLDKTWESRVSLYKLLMKHLNWPRGFLKLEE